MRAIPSIYLGCAARPFARRVRFDARRGRAADRRSDAFDWTIALKAFSDALQSSIPALPSLEDRGRGRAGRHGQNHGAQSHHPSSDYFIPYMVVGKPIPTTELWSRIVTQPNEKARCVCQYVHPTPPCPASANTARDDGKANSPMMMDAPRRVSFPTARPRLAAPAPSANMIDGQKCSRRIDRARPPSLLPSHPVRSPRMTSSFSYRRRQRPPAPARARPSIHSSLYLAHPLPLLFRCFQARLADQSIHPSCFPSALSASNLVENTLSSFSTALFQSSGPIGSPVFLVRGCGSFSSLNMECNKPVVALSWSRCMGSRRGRKGKKGEGAPSPAGFGIRLSYPVMKT